MKKIPVGATIAHSYRFAFRDFFKLLGVMWLPLALMWLPGLLLRQRMTELSAQMAAHDFSGLREFLPFIVPMYLAIAILTFMQIIGVAKLALGLRTGSNWYYFSLGKPLWRLIGSLLLLAVALIVGWIAILLGAALLGAIATILGKLVSFPLFGRIAGILTVVVLIALWCGYIYSLFRLTFLLTPAVAAEVEGFAIARSWALGLGNFWRMFAVFLSVFIPFLVLEFVFIFGFLWKGIPFQTTQSAEQSAALQAAINARSMAMMNQMHHYWYIIYPVGITFMVLFYGLAVGSQCFAYRALTEDEGLAPIAGD